MSSKIWMVTTIILAIVLIAVLVMSYGGRSETSIGGIGTDWLVDPQQRGLQESQSQKYTSIDQLVSDMEEDGLAKKAILMIIYKDDGTIEYEKLTSGSNIGRINEAKNALTEIKANPIKITIVYDDGTHKDKWLVK